MLDACATALFPIVLKDYMRATDEQPKVVYEVHPPRTAGAKPNLHRIYG